MKKFNLKALMLIVLALVMVFALVACGEKSNTTDTKKPSTTTEVKASDYFNALTESIKSIGNTAITSSQDIYAQIGAGISLSNGSNVNLDLEVQIELVYDRTHDNQNSAAHLSIIDKAGTLTKVTEGGQAILEMFYFLNDPTFIYLNAFDQQIKLEFDATGTENDSLAGNLTDFLTSNFETGMFQGKSLDGFITTIASKFGPDFTLDVLVDTIASQIMGISTAELISPVAGMIGSEATDINGLLNAVSGLLISTDKNAVTKVTEGSKTVWTAKLGSLVNNLAEGFLSGVLDSESNLALAFTLDNGAIDEFSVSGKTAVLGTGSNASRYDLKIAITDFKFKGVDAATNPIKAEGDYKTDYVIEAVLEADLAKDKIKLTFEDPFTTVAEDGDTSFADICTEFGKDKATLNITLPNGLEIEGKLVANLKGKVSLANTLGFSKAHFDIQYVSKDGGTIGTVAELIYQEIEVAGKKQGQVQIAIVDSSNKYIGIVRDNLFVAMINALYNADDKAEYGNYTTEINAMFDAIEGKVNAFTLSNIQLQDLFQNIFFGEKKVGKAATATELKTLNIVNIEEKAIANNYIKVGVDAYKLIKEADEVAGVAIDSNAYAINAKSPYAGQKVVYYTDDLGNDLVYTYANLFKTFANGRVVAEYPVSFNIAQVLNIALDHMTIANNNVKVVTAQGIFNALFGYAGATAAESASLYRNGEDVGYIYMGILETGAVTNSNEVITGYDSISTAEELYAAVYKGSATAIKRMTDANLLPAIKIVESASGEYAYLNGVLVVYDSKNKYDSQTRYTLTKEFGHTVGTDGWCYQNGYTLSKAEALVMWKVTAGVEVTAAEWLGIGASAPEAAVVEALYNEGIVKDLKDILAGSNIVDFTKDGNEIFDALLALNVEVNIVTNANHIAVEIEIPNVATASFNFTISTAQANVDALDKAIAAFAAKYETAKAAGEFVFDMSIWMPTV